MFHNISTDILSRMRYLEAMDKEDRENGTARLKRLRQIPPDTGKFLALLASSCPKGNFIEIGTSAGYSTLWLILAAKEMDFTITTFEKLPEKIEIAKETFRIANVEQYVNLIEGNAVDHLNKIENISFCFLDAEKEIYETCYELVKNKIIKNGLLVADNAINHYETIKPMIDKVMKNENFDSIIVPIGKGELICRRI
ncbi:MAG: class I SAM-dependent methyltransferase [Ignavibacteriaceae bacterium]|nr:class I SAM-dependent methyltransferase [Ignavibacteriaceae bacterium]